MLSLTSGNKARPPAVAVPDTVATDDDEGNMGANSLLGAEALRMFGHSQTATSSSSIPQSPQHDLHNQDTVLTIPDTYGASSYGPTLSIPQSPSPGVDQQPLLQWMQPSSSPPRLQRRQSEALLASASVNAGVYRSTSETADDATGYYKAGSSSSSIPQPFYGVELRKGPRRTASSQLLRGSMRAPYRQRSLLSRGPPPLLQAHRRQSSHEYEASHTPRMPEMIEMISNPLSRLNSDGPESSGGSYLVELSPDSYEPLQSVIQETEPVAGQLPVMPEEEPEVWLSLYTRLCKPLGSYTYLHTAFELLSMNRGCSMTVVGCIKPCIPPQTCWYTSLTSS